MQPKTRKSTNSSIIKTALEEFKNEIKLEIKEETRTINQTLLNGFAALDKRIDMNNQKHDLEITALKGRVEKIENRGYEWIKYVITALIGGVIAIAIALMTKSMTFKSSYLLNPKYYYADPPKQRMLCRSPELDKLSK